MLTVIMRERHGTKTVTQRTRILRTLLASALCAGMVALAGCAAEAAPEPVVIPTVVWPDGEPTGELESDPWVVAARKATVVDAIAFNAKDYSIPLLSESLTSSNIAGNYSHETGNAYFKKTSASSWSRDVVADICRA